jgi:hypothetical protein
MYYTGRQLRTQLRTQRRLEEALSLQGLGNDEYGVVAQPQPEPVSPLSFTITAPPAVYGRYGRGQTYAGAPVVPETVARYYYPNQPLMKVITAKAKPGPVYSRSLYVDYREPWLSNEQEYQFYKLMEKSKKMLPEREQKAIREARERALEREKQMLQAESAARNNAYNFYLELTTMYVGDLSSKKWFKVPEWSSDLNYGELIGRIREYAPVIISNMEEELLRYSKEPNKFLDKNRKMIQRWKNALRAIDDGSFSGRDYGSAYDLPSVQTRWGS